MNDALKPRYAIINETDAPQEDMVVQFVREETRNA